MIEITDLFAPCSPGSLMRSIRVSRVGLSRLARRSVELYSVQIVSSGAWGRIRVMDGHMRSLFEQPSTFTGSFWLGAGAMGGLIVELSALSDSDAANLTINFREPDERMA